MGRRERRLAKERKDRIGAFLGAVALLVLLGLYAWGQVIEPPELDGANCPADGRYAAQIAILVDPSDTLTVVQASVGGRILDLIENEAPETAEIRVFTVARTGRQDTSAVLRLCKPQHPEDASSAPGSQRHAIDEYQENFIDPLRMTLSTLLDAAGDSISPILEAIQVVAVNSFQPRDDRSIPRRLIVVSDMIQNSGNHSFYTDPVDFGDLSRNPDYGTLRVDLSGVSVSVFLLARRSQAGRIQQGGLHRFWEDYFIDSGVEPGRELRWIAVEG